MSFMLAACDFWPVWEGNKEAMYSSDLVTWILDTVDAKLTGEHNSAVEAQANPKRKPKKGQKIESFARPLAPARWRAAITEAQQKRDEQRESQRDIELQRVEAMIENLKGLGSKNQA
jgi:hypothetical protein